MPKNTSTMPMAMKDCVSTQLRPDKEPDSNPRRIQLHKRVQKNLDHLDLSLSISRMVRACRMFDVLTPYQDARGPLYHRPHMLGKDGLRYGFLR